MTQTVKWIIIFAISLLVLVKGSDYFSDSIEKVGLFFGIPAFIVGVTLVTLGTTLPELVSSLFAIARNSSEIVAGTVIGSNITNIFLVLGVAIMFCEGKVEIDHDLLHVDLPLMVGSIFLLAITVWNGVFSVREAFVCLLLFLVYLLYNINARKRERSKILGKEIKKEAREEGEMNFSTVIVILASVALIYFGAKYTIESVIHLSEIFNVGKEIIAITAVALGTSLPELVVAVSFVRKGKAEIAVGNVMGANMLNTLGVMGITGIFGDLIIPADLVIFGVPMMIIATLLYFFITQDKEITKWEGALLIIFYILFVGKVLAFL